RILSVMENGRPDILRLKNQAGFREQGRLPSQLLGRLDARRRRLEFRPLRQRQSYGIIEPKWGLRNGEASEQQHGGESNFVDHQKCRPPPFLGRTAQVRLLVSPA